MDIKSNILLIGMPGCGKSTVGKIISRKTGMPHIDTDKIIEEREGMRLQEIIEKKGLKYFEELEKSTLEEISASGSIISPGGSAVCWPEAMEHLKADCTVLYLKTDVDTLLRHIRDLKGRGITFKPGQDFEDLYRERTPLYEKYADIVVTAGLASPNLVAENIIKDLSLKRRSHSSASKR